MIRQPSGEKKNPCARGSRQTENRDIEAQGGLTIIQQPYSSDRLITILLEQMIRQPYSSEK